MRIWRAQRRQTAYIQITPNTYAGHKRQQKPADTQTPAGFP
ncbi:hypothetical protein [Secundilactobacillus similis]|nr:hypothetical protein [Secundilactobacillus similis]